MICSHCQKQNRNESKFCRFCGGDFSQQSNYTINSEEGSHFQIRIPKNLFKKISPKVGVIILIIITLTATTVYAAPKLNGFVKVRAAIQEAKEKQNLGEYQAAIDVLSAVKNRWSLKSQKQELITLKTNEEKFINYEKVIADSVEKEKTGNLKGARDLLQSIETDYPKYESSVQPKLSELQKNIERNLEEKVGIANTAKKAAEKRATEEVAAKIQAEAESRAATDAKVRADANAAAAAQTAREAEQQAAIQRAAAEQAAIKAAEQKAEQVQISFLNQLTASYKSYQQAKDYYGSAISYSNSGNSISAISQSTSAKAVLTSALNSINSEFTGLPSNYYTATSDMLKAIDYLSKALDLLVSSEGTSLDYSSTINSYKNSSINYADKVYSFIMSL